MEDSFDARLNGDYRPQTGGEKKGGKGWMITSIVLMILLVGAGTLAVIGFLPKDSKEVDDLKAQVATRDTRIIELESDVSTKETEIATLKNSTVTPSQTTPANNTTKLQDGYIYLPSWGVKINMNNAKSVSYLYDAEANSLTLWALDPSISQATLPEFANPEKNTSGLGAIEFSKTRKNIENIGSAPELIYEIPNNGGYIYYYHLQQAYSNENGAKGDGELEMKSVDYLDKKVFVKSSFSAL